MQLLNFKFGHGIIIQSNMFESGIIEYNFYMQG